MTKSSMKKRLFLILIPIVILASAMFYHYMHKTHFTTSFEIGNSAGNLYNGGKYCEYDGVIYFANPNDNDRLYSMSRNGTDVKKLSDDVASYINADSHYLYYTRNNSSNKTAFSFLHVQENSLCRVDHNGRNLKILSNDPSMYAKQVGNYIYYVHYDTKTASTLYRVKIDGSENTQIKNAPIIPAASLGENLYFAGVSSNHDLYQMNTVSNAMVSLYQGDCYNPIIDNTTVYFMNDNDDYSLTKLDLSTGTTTVIVSARIDCFNLYGDWIYFQQNDGEQALYRIQTDGTSLEKVMDGNFTGINITSSYVYFSSFQDDTLHYKTPTNGAVNVTIFNP